MASIWGDSAFDEPRRRPRPGDAFGGTSGATPQQNAGLPGGTAGPNPPPPSAPPPAAPTPSYAIQPVDLAKWTDPTKHDPKYDFLHAASAFDPTKGVQSGLLDALNHQGYATWFGSGQHLGYKDVTDAGKQNGLNPAGFQGDFIQHWANGTNPNAQWAWDWSEGGADPFSAAAAPPKADPYASLPSWLTDGLNPNDMLRLAYNTYLGREPESPQVGTSPYGMTDPRMLDLLDTIATSAEAQQYKDAHPGGAPPPPVPQMYASQGGPQAISRALQMLAMKLPQAAASPSGSSDPLLRWLLSILGVS